MTWDVVRRFARQVSLFFCLHPNLKFVRNIYGDEINVWSGNRSIWRCRRCGRTVPQPFLSQYSKDDAI